MTLPEYLKPFRETVDARLESDPEFAKAYTAELRADLRMQSAHVEGLERLIGEYREIHKRAFTLAARVEALEKALREFTEPPSLVLANRYWTCKFCAGRPVILSREFVHEGDCYAEAARKLLEGK